MFLASLLKEHNMYLFYVKKLIEKVFQLVHGKFFSNSRNAYSHMNTMSSQ